MEVACLTSWGECNEIMPENVLSAELDTWSTNPCIEKGSVEKSSVFIARHATLGFKYPRAAHLFLAM